MLSVRTGTAVGVYTVAGITGAILFLYATPAIERFFYPILVDQKVTVAPEDRTPGRVCWTWHWNKARYATPIAVSYTITVEGTAVEFPVVTERKRDGSILRAPKIGSLGPGENEFCATIPSEIDGLKTELVIKGQMTYRMPHGLWEIWQDIPPIRVPPLRNG